MGCDIHCEAHKVNEDGSYTVLDFSPFDWRCYGLFGFLANVRNYSCVPPIAESRGLPEWVTRQKEQKEPYSMYGCHDENDYFSFGEHSFTYLMVAELLNFDYDSTFEDRRCSINGNGGSTCDVGQGTIVSFREFLGEGFFEDLETLKELNANAIVFGFDS
jgi:hypothetical protein